jgi:hypothetical protein
MSLTRHTNPIRWGLLLVTSLLLTLGAAAPASAAPERVGAGQNNPRFNDGYARYWYSCTDEGNFKIDQAKIVMWSNGRNRVKGFHFKYRIVAADTEGQPVTYSNWSPNTSVSFDQGTVQSKWMTSGAQGQAWNPAADWDLEIKLKYPRSLRTAYSFKYRRDFIEPTCG